MPAPAETMMPSSLTDAAQSYARLAASFWTLPVQVMTSFVSTTLEPPPEPPKAKARSWYRPPTPDPFDMSVWFKAWQPPDPFGMRGSAVAAWMAAASSHSWPGWRPAMGLPAMGLSAVQPWGFGFPPYWASTPTPFLPPSQITNYPVAMFSAYRSDSGHAVAQIMMDTLASAARLQADLAEPKRWH